MVDLMSASGLQLAAQHCLAWLFAIDVGIESGRASCRAEPNLH